MRVKSKRHPVVRHKKYHGFVESVSLPFLKDGAWEARLVINGEDHFATMDPLPEDQRKHLVEGAFFTIHLPKKGDPYFHWVRIPITKRMVKKARIEARDLRKRLNLDAVVAASEMR